MALSNQKTKSFYQWLAGFIDGDGYFYVDSKNHPRFEITTNIEDEHLLQQIKQHFPGSLKVRSGAQAVRLRISEKDVLKRLILAINGQLHLPKRQNQLKMVCSYFHIPFQLGQSLGSNNAYLAGLMDSDGTITITVAKTNAQMSIEKGVEGKIRRLQFSRGYHQLRCRITSIDRSFLEKLVLSFGFGKLYRQKANKSNRHPNVLYHWTCQNKEDINHFLSYMQKYRLRSQKRKRCFLIPKYLYLISQKVHLSEDASIQKKVWLDFCRKWFKG